MKAFIALLAALTFLPAALGEESRLAWPQFRGPNGSGVADEQRAPIEFSADKNLKWKVPVPSGLSSPIVVGDKLVLTALDDGKLCTIAYDRATGNEAWRAIAPAHQIEAYLKGEGSPAASTPATDGTRIVSYFGSCGLICYDLAGKKLWRFELPPASTVGNFGSGVSPIVAAGVVVLVRDMLKDSKIFVLDATTGKVRWERQRQSPASYCTPVVWDTPSGKQIVAAGHARMTGYELQTGKEQWFLSSLPSGCCASPVTAGGLLYFAGWSPGGADDKEFQMPKFDDLLKDLDTNKDGSLTRDEAEKAFQGFFDTQDANQDGRITREEHEAILKFVSEGQNCAFALKAGGAADVSATHMLWKQTKGLPYVPSVIVYQGQMVMIKDGGVVTAYDANTGAELYQGRLAASGKYYASPVAANGHIYFSSLDGDITAVKAGSPKLVSVAKNGLGERIAATPAIADNTLYVRSDKHLYAFAEKP